LGGAVAASATGISPTQAKLIANGTGKIGATVIIPGAPNPTGALPGSTTYGLIASANNTSINLSSLPTGGIGVYGTGSTGVFGNGIYGLYGYASDRGVYGYSNGSGTTYGVYGTANGVGNGAVTYGVYGESITDDSSGTGVYGKGNSYGVYGESVWAGLFGKGGSYGVEGLGTLSGSFGVYGSAPNSGYSCGVYGAGAFYGIFGDSSTGSPGGYAGYFTGPTHVNGTLTKTAGSFKIDHPLDPANKYLYHSFVESPDMMNIYNGIVTLDNQGEAIVTMPEWFEALNSDFRYQLTSLNEFMPLFIAEKLVSRRFKIAGGKAGQEVSWQVTGIRQDAFAKTHRIPVEEDKTEVEKGKYLHPALFGESEEKSVHLRPAVDRVALK
jgi:hypothetical protein